MYNDRHQVCVEYIQSSITTSKQKTVWQPNSGSQCTPRPSIPRTQIVAQSQRQTAVSCRQALYRYGDAHTPNALIPLLTPPHTPLTLICAVGRASTPRSGAALQRSIRRGGHCNRHCDLQAQTTAASRHYGCKRVSIAFAAQIPSWEYQRLKPQSDSPRRRVGKLGTQLTSHSGTKQADAKCT